MRNRLKHGRLLALGSLLLLPLAGCGTWGEGFFSNLAENAAEEPYREGMENGRLSPAEYQAMRNERSTTVDRD